MVGRSNAQEASPQISGHSDIVWPSFNSWQKIGHRAFGFSKNRKLCALICTTFRLVFFKGINPINEEKFQREIQEKLEAKKPEKRPRNGDRKATQKWPKVQGRREAWKSRSPDFRQKCRFSVLFRVSRCLAPVIFLKSDFWGMISVDLRQHHGSAIEIIWSSSDTPKLPTGRPRKHTFCPTDQEIDWTDAAGPLVATNVWIFIVIRHQTTYRSIDDHRKKNSKRRGAARDSSSDSTAN